MHPLHQIYNLPVNFSYESNISLLVQDNCSVFCYLKPNVTLTYTGKKPCFCIIM